jgi:hypothetical protein
MQEFLTRARDGIRRRADLALVLVALAYGLPSLAYPLGRDQASLYYVGREWLHGLLPFRDAFAEQPPGIYALHALSILLLGERQWGIRLCELSAVMAMGWMVWRAVRRSSPSAPGELGIASILIAGFYYSYFDWWDTGRVEIWSGFALIGGWLVAERSARPRLRAAMSGLLSAAALLLAFPAVLVALATAVRVAVRAFREAGWRGALEAVVLHLAAGGALIGLVYGYFAHFNGADEMLDVLFGYAPRVARRNATPRPVAIGLFVAWLWRCRIWLPLTVGGWLFGLFAARRRSDRVALAGAASAAALTALALASALADRRFHSYHFGLAVPFVALAAAQGLTELARRAPSLAAAAALVTLGVGWAWGPNWYARPGDNYRDYSISFAHYIRGTLPRSDFIAQFTGPDGFDYKTEEELGEAIRDRARPGDPLRVDGFEPTIYAVSGLRCPTRFFANHHLSDPALDYKHRADWQEHEDAQLIKHPPRFVVVSGEHNCDHRAYHFVMRVASYQLCARGQ